MSCYHPIKAYKTATGVSFTELRRNGDFIADIELPCGRCIGCRMARAAEWSVRCMHESSLWEENSFLTLTYDEENLPANGSLDHGDVQRFLKRVRKTGRKVRFFMCGEYGGETGRPHYHMCLFNKDFRDRTLWSKSGSGEKLFVSEELSRLWPAGRATVQDLTVGTAGYCARYIMKKALGQDAESAYLVLDEESGENVQLKPEYAAMSLKPGIGALWWRLHGAQVTRNDFVVLEGKELPVPSYYDKLRSRGADLRADEIEWARYQTALLSRGENTDDRLAVREVVHNARIRTLSRSLE